jgi:hypothetical protein
MMNLKCKAAGLEMNVLISTTTETFTNIFMKNAISGMLIHVALVKTDISEEHTASATRVTRIGEPGTTSAVARISISSS